MASGAFAKLYQGFEDGGGLELMVVVGDPGGQMGLGRRLSKRR